MGEMRADSLQGQGRARQGCVGHCSLDFLEVGVLASWHFGELEYWHFSLLVQNPSLRAFNF